MTDGTTQEFAAFLGLDGADGPPEVWLHAAGSDKRAGQPLPPRPEVMEAWGTALRQRFEGQPIALALALHKGPLVEALRTEDGLGRFPINPLRLARYRHAFTPRRAKDAPPEAELQLARLRRHCEKRKLLVPQRPAMRALAPWVAHRRRLVGERGRITPRLPSPLQTYVPDVRQGGPHADTRLFCALRRQWPTLKAAHRARRRPLERLWHQPHVREELRRHEGLAAIKSAGPLTTDAGGLRPNALRAQALRAPGRVLCEAIERFDHAMAARAPRHPAYALCEAGPGAGPA
jgi:hypothetical protein